MMQNAEYSNTNKGHEGHFHGTWKRNINDSKRKKKWITEEIKMIEGRHKLKKELGGISQT